MSTLIGLGGAGLSIFEFDRGRSTGPTGPGVIRLGVHRRGSLPADGLADYDLLLSADPESPRPWVGVQPDQLEGRVAQLRSVVDRQPIAATVAAQVHRMTLRLSFEEALALESLGYSMLLWSAPFRAWRAATPVRDRADAGTPRVALSRGDDGVISIRMTRPDARNAVDAPMRDALAEALQFAIDDPDGAPVVLTGEGPSFSAGGDLDEFGQAEDPGLAHLIRVLRAPVRHVHQIRDRVTARVQGACVGAGIEIPAAAGRVVARPDAYFRLPEVAMGLIPGAGGTASIPRRIGRRRAAYMAISGLDIDGATALRWGLIDALEA